MRRGIATHTVDEVRKDVLPRHVKPSPFFELPRELRDDVYGRCTRRGDLSKICHDVANIEQAGVDLAVLPTLRLVSKHFKQEYEEEVMRDPRSRSAWIVLSESSDLEDYDYDGSGRRNPSYGPPREVDALSGLLNCVPELRVNYYPLHIGEPGIVKDFRTFIAFMPALKRVQIEALNVYIGEFEGMTLQDRKDNLQRAKCELLYDSSGGLLGDFSVQEIIHAHFPTFEVNRHHVAALYQGLLRPGYISVEQIIQMFEMHPARYRRYKLKESNAVHTLDGFEVEDDAFQMYRKTNFADIEHDVVSKLRLHHDADAAPLDWKILSRWDWELRNYYRL